MSEVGADFVPHAAGSPRLRARTPTTPLTEGAPEAQTLLGLHRVLPSPRRLIARVQIASSVAFFGDLAGHLVFGDPFLG